MHKQKSVPPVAETDFTNYFRARIGNVFEERYDFVQDLLDLELTLTEAIGSAECGQLRDLLS